MGHAGQTVFVCVCVLCARVPIHVCHSVQGDCPQLLHKVRGQADGIAHLVWSPDDSMLLSCGREDSPEALVFCTRVSHWSVSCALVGQLCTGRSTVHWSVGVACFAS